MSYQALAAVYDLLMEEIDYQQWADYIHSLLEEQHCPGKRLLDLGCGTGSITMLLAQKGYRITAVIYRQICWRSRGVKIRRSICPFGGNSRI